MWSTPHDSSASSSLSSLHAANAAMYSFACTENAMSGSSCTRHGHQKTCDSSLGSVVKSSRTAGISSSGPAFVHMLSGAYRHPSGSSASAPA